MTKVSLKMIFLMINFQILYKKIDKKRKIMYYVSEKETKKEIKICRKKIRITQIGNRTDFIRSGCGEMKVTKEYVAKRIGITNKKLENKLEGKEEFYISEIIELTKIFNLNIEECAKTFFNEDKFI